LLIRRIAIDHRALDLRRTARRIDDAGEFHHAVAGGLDVATAVPGDLGIN
jgi:hypothetical protein